MLYCQEIEVKFIFYLLGENFDLIRITMGLRGKTVVPHPSPPPSPMQSDNLSESSSSKVQINTTIEEYSPRGTRSRTTRAILQDTHSQSKEEGSGSESGEESSSGFGRGEASGSGSGNSEEYALYLHRRSEDFFKNGIMSKSGKFSGRPVIPETRVVVLDIQAFLDIHRTFQGHHVGWMNNSHREFSLHITREFYSSYAITLMNFVAHTETTKKDQKEFASTWGPLNSIVVRGTFVDISEAAINRMLHGPTYTPPTSVGLFEGKQHTITSESEMEDPTSRYRIMLWIAWIITSEGKNVAWVTGPHVHITKALLSFPTKVWWVLFMHSCGL
ncbi:hypothetical protein KY290_013406 [Solanum tuberosum]|uniref:Putative plant transposon protein domain-containing protein n=1 Tax=Solanum tuberosum TaxID=4113 RepID=A0ABQ7VNP6_SOLTU|nr:hypothetical protein KY290_013406 [Solanum tuberosum]